MTAAEIAAQEQRLNRIADLYGKARVVRVDGERRLVTDWTDEEREVLGFLRLMVGLDAKVTLPCTYGG